MDSKKKDPPLWWVF